jgi:hypothetical protein
MTSLTLRNCSFINGFAITVAENDDAIRMEDAALEVVKKRILGENKRKNDDDMTTNNNKKQGQTGGNAAVSTVYGATHLVLVHHLSHRRNLKQNKKAREKALTGMDRELRNIQAMMLLVEKRKKLFAGLERESDGRQSGSCCNRRTRTCVSKALCRRL